MTKAKARLVSKTPLGVLDLFAGVGGLAQGFDFLTKRFESRLLVDFDEDCRTTWMHNRPKVPFICADLREASASELLKTAGLSREDIDVVVGGPPCQGFSMAGKRDFDDPRNKLFQHFIEIVRDLKPLAIVMENVPHLLTLWGGEFQKQVFRRIGQLGYVIDAKPLLASDYGVPQIRRRAIIYAIREDVGVKEIRFPVATHEPVGNAIDILRGLRKGRGVERANGGLKPFVTVEEAIGDLNPLKSGEGEDVCAYQHQPSSEYQRERRKNAKLLYNHKAWNHTKSLLRKMAMIPEGGRHMELPPDKQFCPGAFSQAYGRLHRNGIAFTITTFIHNPGSGRFVHYRDLRAITVREGARIQSFDDDFRFLGVMASQERQIGNAVPPIFAQAIASNLADML